LSYLFTYLLPHKYSISYPVGYPGNELPITAALITTP